MRVLLFFPVAFCCSILMPSLFVAGDYVAEVLVLSYANPTNRCVKYDGGCCDEPCDSNRCDNYFRYCLRSLNTPDTERGCATPPLISSVNEDATLIDFTQDNVLGLPNPLLLQGTGSWQGIQLYVEVTDYDSHNSDDLIDVFTVNIDDRFPVGGSLSQSSYAGVYGYGTINLSIRLSCTEGYYGDSCQYRNECLLNSITCNGQGVCVNKTNTYTCNCNPGYTGGDCELIDYCSQSGVNCKLPYGQCQNGLSSYTCVCNLGFTGADCEININGCENDSCNGHGTCQDLINSHICNCDVGYMGSDCRVNIDDCVGVNCSGNGLGLGAGGGKGIEAVVGGVLGTLLVIVLIFQLIIIVLFIYRAKITQGLKDGQDVSNSEVQLQMSGCSQQGVYTAHETRESEHNPRHYDLSST